MILSLFLATATLAPDFGAPEISGSWIAGCDNRGDCVLTNLPVDENGDGDIDTGIAIEITRNYDVRRPVMVRLAPLMTAEELAGVTAPVIRVDGRPVPLRLNWKDGAITVAATDAVTLVRAMRSSEIIEIVSGTRILSSARINGLTPLLTMADALQNRVGTTAALAKPGRKPANIRSIPPHAPDAPILAPPLSNAPPTPLADAKFADILRSDPCRDHADKDAPSPDAEYIRLDRDTTLALVGTYCGGYNPAMRLFLINNDGSARPAPFGPHPFYDPAEAETTLPGAWWDDKAHALGSFGRTRGLGDCGQQVRYAWDGRAFQTIQYASMPECRGSYNYAVTYRKDVRR